MCTFTWVELNGNKIVHLLWLPRRQYLGNLVASSIQIAVPQALRAPKVLMQLYAHVFSAHQAMVKGQPQLVCWSGTDLGTEGWEGKKASLQAVASSQIFLCGPSPGLCPCLLPE